MLKKIGNVLLLFLCCAVSPDRAAADFYRYTDEKGTVCITDNLGTVPEKYRSSVTVIRTADARPAEEVDAKRLEEGGWVEAAGQKSEEILDTLIVTVREYPYDKLGISSAIYVVSIAFLFLFLVRRLDRRRLGLIAIVLLTAGFGIYVFRLEVQETHRKYVKLRAHVEKVQQQLGKNAAEQAKAFKEVEEILKNAN